MSVQDLNGDALLSSCEQVDLPLRLTSVTNVVDVTVEAKSKGAYPKRGVLLHYKSKIFPRFYIATFFLRHLAPSINIFFKLHLVKQRHLTTSFRTFFKFYSL